MKKEVIGLFVLGLVFVIGFSFVSGAVCPDDETILRLYQDTNSHGAEFDQTTYPVQVCTPDGLPNQGHSFTGYFF